MVNQIMPLNISCIGTSGVMVLTINTFVPMGGVTIAISVMMTTKTPNQTGSIPRLSVTGKKKGIERTSIPKISSIIPKTK